MFELLMRTMPEIRVIDCASHHNAYFSCRAAQHGFERAPEWGVLFRDTKEELP